MKINLFSDLINNQLEFLLPRSLIADGVLILVSLPFYGLDISVPLGLCLGTLAMLVNMVMLGISVQKATDCRTEKSARRCMFKYYLLRFAVLGAAIAAGFLLPFTNAIASCIPIFYPKLFYSMSGILSRNKDKNKRKRNH
ncbi:MAG: hypothetical protein LIO69_01865 [Oscillospiraceae bacterium]|nr:hypothetical protein [Oscillospiraceae bacterium]